jgi:hypothetical protein
MLNTDINVLEPREVWSRIMHDTLSTGQQEILWIFLDAGVDTDSCYCEDHGHRVLSQLGCAINALSCVPELNIEQMHLQLTIGSMLVEAGSHLDTFCYRSRNEEYDYHIPLLHFALSVLRYFQETLYSVVRDQRDGRYTPSRDPKVSKRRIARQEQKP